MKYFLLPLLMLYGCDGAYKKEVVKMPEPIQINIDSVVNELSKGFSIPDSNRYFLISYTYTSTDSHSGGEGYCTYVCKNAFPSKKELDISIFQALPYVRSCYQSIIITSIFEFHNKADFLSFDSGNTGGAKYIPLKNKKHCQ